MSKLKHKMMSQIKMIRNRFVYQEPDLQPGEYLVLSDRKLVFIVLSKVACTSIKATIGQKYGIAPENQSGLDIHHHPQFEKRFRRLEGDANKYFKFAFVRNPLTRLVSCYRDRVLYTGPNEDLSDYYFSDLPYDIPANCSFADFVHRIAKIPDHYADRHFKSQSHSLFSKGKNLEPDFIGRFEDLQAGWTKIANKFDLPEKIGHFHSTQNKPKVEKKTLFGIL